MGKSTRRNEYKDIQEAELSSAHKEKQDVELSKEYKQKEEVVLGFIRFSEF